MKPGLARRVVKWSLLLIAWVSLYGWQQSLVPDRVPSEICFRGHACEKVVYPPEETSGTAQR